MSRKSARNGSIRTEKGSLEAHSLARTSSELTNTQDQEVLKELEGARFGSLDVDRFAPLIRASGESDEVAVGRLRHEIAKIYLRAARKRAQKRVSAEQLRRADAALQSIRKGIEQLETLTPEGPGLWLYPIERNDPKGENGVTEFSTLCSSYRARGLSLAVALEDAINAERSKEVGRGERKKRLRIMVEELAAWWTATTQKPVSPTVNSKRRDGAPSIVLGRTGQFLEFGKSILFELDSFNPTEVESAVANVSRRLPPQSS